MEAVADLRKRGRCNLQKMQAILAGLPAEAFHNIRGYRERGSPQLRGELEPFKWREPARERVKGDKEIVCTLPRDY